MMQNKPVTIDEYIDLYDAEVKDRLQRIRQIIRDHAPDAEEVINYGIPTVKMKGKNLVHFAAFKKHIGFYATPSGHKSFQKQLSKYKQGKGSVQFPHNDPLPIELIKEIVIFRVYELSSKT